LLVLAALSKKKERFCSEILQSDKKREFDGCGEDLFPPRGILQKEIFRRTGLLVRRG
jgi:hypothetical protein